MGCSVSVVLLFKRGWDLVIESVGAECVCLTGAICPACGHWWHLCVHFQDVLGKPSRKMFWYRQKWSFLKASEEMDKWLDSGGTTLGNSGDLILTNHMLFYWSGTLQEGRKRLWREIDWARGARVVTLLNELLEGPALKQIGNSKVRLLHWHTAGAWWSWAANPWQLTIIDESVNSPTEKAEGEWVPIILWLLREPPQRGLKRNKIEIQRCWVRVLIWQLLSYVGVKHLILYPSLNWTIICSLYLVWRREVWVTPEPLVTLNKNSVIKWGQGGG